MGKRVRKALPAMAVSLLLVFLLAACGTGGAGNASGNAPASGGTDVPQAAGGSGGDGAKGKITIRYATGDAGPAVTLQEQIVKRFNESQDRIEAVLETYGTAFDQKLTAAIGSGNAPDVVKMWNFPAYHAALVPLEDRIDALDDKDDFYQTLFNYANMNGHIYGMPIGFSTRALHYNKAIIEKAGIAVKDDWTMEEFREAAIAATDGDVKGLYFYYNPDPYAFESFLWSNGGAWLDDDGRPVVNSEANKEAIRFIHDLIYKDKAGHAGNLADDFGQVMASGKYAFGEMGKWFISSILDAGVDIGIAPLPGFKEGSSMSVVHAAFLSITNNSQNQDAAWEFIKYYTSYDVVKQLMEIEMPVRESVAADIGYLDDPLIKPFYTMLERSESERPALVKSEKWPEISAEIQTALEAIFSQEQVDIGAILDEVQKRAEAIVQ